jgi:hypothetical protein
LAEDSTTASITDIDQAFRRALGEQGFKRLVRGPTRFGSPRDNPFAKLDPGPATAIVLAEMPNSPRSFVSIQLEIWDLGTTRRYRVLHLGVSGWLGSAASRGEMRKRARRFEEQL